MSSSGDDLDEDELLQMALREQDERDLSHQRPPKKPVVNLVRKPPPPQRSRQNPAQQQQKGKATRVDDDDDSEVELLSISSGDDEPVKDREKEAGKKGRRRADLASGDQGGWDGEEPACWKHVDEAELARRVREMRDTRVAPVTPATDQKAAALGKKGLANLQSLPRGVEALDPLGLGIIDSRSLTLITEASVSTPTSADKANKEILDPRTREKLNFYSENFDAKLFLSRVHKDTSAADLEAGAISLKTDLKGRTQQKKKLVKENFDCFVSCKTTIDDIESKLRQIEEDPEGSGTAQLYESTQKINMLANRAFQPLFERQVQAEKIRSVQGMLQRFRTLFNLPSTIRGSISKGEYDLAVREYRKAKSIVLPSHVGILKRVLEEVEKVMCEFKAMLHKSMEDPHLELADLENTVRLLLELEPNSDPVWHYLNIQNRRIQGLLEKCSMDHETRMGILHNKIREKELSDARWRQLQLDSNKSLDIDSFNVEDSHYQVDSHVDSTTEDALKERYIRRLTAVLLHHIPMFWRLALSVFSGKFAKVSAGSLLLDPESNTKMATSRTDEKVVDMKYSSHSLDEVAVMVHNTISVYESKVLNTFRDFEESNVLCPYMTNVISEIAKACQAFEGKESAPPSAVTTLNGLHFEITKIYISRLCLWMRATVEGLSETWVPLSVLERNRSPYTISSLPLEFRTVTVSAMDQIVMMVERLRSEAKSNDMFAQIQETQETIRVAFLNCFLDFAGYLERIGSALSQNRLSREDSYLEKENSPEPGGISGFCSGCAVSDPHKKILVVLSNAGYCKDELCDEMYRKYVHIWLQPRDGEQYADVRELMTSYSALEEKVLEQYTFAKANFIRTAASNYLLDTGIHWGGAPSVKGIRDATIELMNTLVSVHAEVSFGAKPLLEKTLGTLVEGLIDTFISLFHEYKAKHLKSLDPNGFCQFMLELEYFETVLDAYFSFEGRESFKSLQGLLLEKASESVVEVSETPKHTRRPTRGSEDALSDDRQQAGTVSPDDLIALAQQYRSELLEGEIERTRLNISCFMESSIQPNPPVKEVPKPSYLSFRGQTNSPSFRTAPQAASSFSRQRRR